MRYRWTVAFIIAIGSAAICCAPSAADQTEHAGELPFEIKPRKPADTVKVIMEKDRAVLDVRSPSGIGGAAIELKDDRWPAATVVRLHLRGLEGFWAAHGKRKLSGSVLSHSGNRRRVSLEEEGVDKLLEPGTEIKLFDAAGKPVDKGLPPEGGYFEIALPKALFEGEKNTLRLDWVDFFRR